MLIAKTLIAFRKIARPLMVLILGLAYLEPAFSGPFMEFDNTRFKRNSGSPQAVVHTFTARSPSAQYYIRAYNLGAEDDDISGELVSDSIITINGVNVYTHGQFHEGFSYIDKAITLQAENVLSVELHGKVGSEIKLHIVGADYDLPSIEATITPPANDQGWNNSATTVSFTCADETSGIRTCSAPTTISTDGANQTVQGEARDYANRRAYLSVVLNIDTVAPSITASLSNTPDAQGNHTAPVTVSFTCHDALSGIQSCAEPVDITQPGTQNVTGVATDNAGNTESTTVTVNLVSTSNQAPVITSTPVTTINENALYVYQVVGEDADQNDTVTYTLVNAPAGMEINPSTGLINWQTTFTSAGNYAVSVVVTDSEGASAQQNFSIDVINVNRPPEVDPVSVELNQNTSANIIINATDPDGDALSYNLISAPANGQVTGSGPNFNYTPNQNFSGGDQFQVEVSDGSDSSIVAVDVVVIAVNSAPVISSVPPTTIVEQEIFTYAVVATDAEGDSLSYTISGAPQSMQIDSITGLVTWITDYDSAGSYQITVTVTDGQLSTDQSFELLVGNTNRAPVISSSPITEIIQNQEYSYSVIATDPDGDVLAFSIVAAPAGVTIDSASGLITAVDGVLAVGEYTIEINVADGNGGSTEQNFLLVVLEPNRAPAFSSAPSLIANGGREYLYQAQASDPDGDTLIYTLINGPTDASIDSVSGQLTWLPSADFGGQVQFAIGVSDGEYSAEQSWNLSVQISPESVGASYLGREFWIAFNVNAEISGAFSIGYSSPDRARWLSISAPEGAEGIVEVPGIGYSTTFTAPEGGLVRVDLPSDVMMQPGTRSANKGVHVVSDRPVAIVATNYAPATTDSYLALPITMIGRDYVIANWFTAPSFVTSNSGEERSHSGGQFSILAIEDFTQVLISPRPRHPIDYNTDPYTVELQKGEIYQFSGTSASGDSNGVSISSNNPVTVTAGSKCATVPQGVNFCDYLGEQLLPNDKAGSHFIGLPHATRLKGEFYRFVALENETSIRANGVLIATLDKGDSLIRNYEGAIEIKSNLPIHVLQISPGTRYDDVESDPFMVSLVPLEASPTNYIFSTPGLTDEGLSAHYLSVAVHENDLDNLILDGILFDTSNFIQVSDSKYHAGVIQIDSGVHTIASANPLSLISYGYGPAHSYGNAVGVIIANSGPITSINADTTIQGVSGDELCVEFDFESDGDIAAYTRFKYELNGQPLGVGYTNGAGVGKVCIESALTNITDELVIRSGGQTSLVSVNWESPTDGVNRPPVFTSQPNLKVYEATYEYLPIVADPNGDSTTISLVAGPEGMYLEGGLLTWDVSAFEETRVVKNIPVTLLVTDAAGLFSEQSFDLMLVPPPTIAAPLQREQVVTGQGYRSFVDVLGGVFENVELSIGDAPQGMTLSRGPAGIDFSPGSSSAIYPPGPNTTRWELNWIPPSQLSFPEQTSKNNPMCRVEGSSVGLHELNALATLWEIEQDADLIATGKISDSNADGVIDHLDDEYLLGVRANRISLLNLTNQTLEWSQTGTIPGRIVPAIADIVGDFEKELLTVRQQSDAPIYRLYAHSPAGEEVWRTTQILIPGEYSQVTTSIVVADLNADGSKEIIVGPYVFDANGNLLWQFPQGSTSYPILHAFPVASDLNGDGFKEVIFRNEIRSFDGAFLWSIDESVGASRPVGLFSTLDINGDGNQEVFASVFDGAQHAIYAWSNSGEQLWDPIVVENPSVLAVADFNRDGLLDIYHSGDSLLLSSDGKLLSDQSGLVTDSTKPVKPTIVDLDGDGLYEVIEIRTSLVIKDLLSGFEWANFNNYRNTYARYSGGISFSDIDNNGNSELIVAGNGKIGIYRAQKDNWQLPDRTFYQYSSDINASDVSDRLATNVDMLSGEAEGLQADLVASNLRLVHSVDGYELTVRVTNRGTEKTVEDNQVQFYAGNRDSGGTLVGAVAVPTLAAGQMFTAVLPLADAESISGEVVAYIEPVYTASPEQQCEYRNDAVSAFHVELSASDAESNYRRSDYRYFLQVLERENSPTVMAPTSLSVVAGDNLSFQVEVTNENIGDSYYFTITPVGTAPVPNVEGGPLFNSLTGEFTWRPTVDHIGTHLWDIVLKFSNGVNLSRRVTLAVTAPPGSAPQIVSTPPNTGIIGTDYLYQIEAVDSDGDILNYSLLQSVGNAIVSDSGLVSWNPETTGEHVITARVDDGAWYVDQTWSVQVTAASQNQMPVISSVPSFSAIENSLYSYQIEASDPDGDSLTYTLVTGPEGVVVHPTEGLLEWTPATSQVGVQQIAVLVDDSRGGSVTQTFSVQVYELQANRAPVITSAPFTGASTDAIYEYLLIANDIDDDVLTFSLVSSPNGMQIDENTGLIQWQPLFESIGNQSVVARVEDGRGGYAEQQFTLVVRENSVPLSITILLNPGIVNPAEPSNVMVQVSGGRGPADVALTMNSEVIALDANNQATVSSENFGAYALFATATDGYQLASDQKTLYVRDPSDLEPPVVNISTPEAGTSITAPIQITGTVQDTNLAEYIVAISPRGRNEFSEIHRSVDEVSEGVLATLDPTLMENGQYDVIVRATDLSGQETSDNTVVLIEGDLKVGSFSFTVEDLNIPLEGIPIQVTRTYDSRKKNKSSDIGFGWTIDYQSMRVDESRPIGSQWELVQIFGQVFDTWCVMPKGKPIVSVTLPSGEVERFEVKASPECNSITPIIDVNTEFVPVGGTQSSLRDANAGTLRLTNGNLEILGDGVPYDTDNYVLTTKAGYVYNLNQNLGVRSIVDPYSNTITYTASGINHSSGKSISFIRDSEGRIESVIDPQGQEITYEYSLSGDLVSVSDQLNSTTRYTYDHSHGLLDIIDPLGRAVVKNIYDYEGRLIGQEDADQNYTAFNHDIEGRLSIVTDRMGRITQHFYDDEGNILTTIDPLNNQTTYSYDSDGNQLSETNALGHTSNATFDDRRNQLSETNALGHTVTFEYNSRSQETRIEDALGNEFLNTYDELGGGLLLTITDPVGNIARNVLFANTGRINTVVDTLGNETDYLYDTFGNKLTETDALGNVTTFTYDVNNNVLSESRQRTLVDNTLVTETTTYEYDARNRLTATINPLGQRSETEYDLAGQVVAEIDAESRRTEMDYDAYGRVIETRYPDGTTSNSSYDAEGNLLTETDRSGNITRFEYDALNRQTAVIDALNNRRETEYDAIGRVVAEIDANNNRTEFEYDAAGRRTLVRDALLQEHRFEYDANGNLIAEVDALNRRTEYTYNALDQRVETRYHDNSVVSQVLDAMGRRTAQIDQAGVATQFDYDALGRLTTVTDIDGNATSYSYDAAGNKLTQTDAEGRTTRWAYDALGRVISRTLPLGQTEYFNYDLSGNLTEHTDFNGNITLHRYDLLNQLIDSEFADGSSEQYSYDNNGNRIQSIQVDSSGLVRTTQFSYDALNRLLTETKPNGTQLSYGYDAAGNKTQLTVTLPDTTQTVTTYGYDALNRLVSVTDASGVTSYSYDAVGNRASVSYANGTSQVYSYDSLNRLTQLNSYNASGTLVQSFAYTLHATGRRTRIDELSGRSTAYSYDNLYRLTSEAVTDAINGNYSASYEYDKVGNRTYQTVDGVQTAYSYDNNDRLLQTGGTVFTYDDQGNTLTETLDGVVTTYSYNAQHEMIAQSQAGVTTNFAYNADGIRNAKADSTSTTTFLIDNNRDYAQVIREENGALVVSYTYGDDLINQTRDGTTSYYHYDGLGSTRGLSDASGSLTDTYDYEAFGELLNQTGSTENSYLYTGEQFDNSLNQYYLRARYYNQSVGRFTQMDTWMGGSSKPITLNKYLYADVDPVLYIDPTGMFSDLGSTSAAINSVGILATIAVSTSFSNGPGTGTKTGLNCANRVIQSKMGVYTKPLSQNDKDCDENLNQMRLQLQQGSVKTWSTVRLAGSNKGVTARDMQGALRELLLEQSQITWFPRALERWLNSSLIQISKNLNLIPPAGGIIRNGTIESLKRETWDLNKEYRVEIENLRGHNLRAIE